MLELNDGRIEVEAEEAASPVHRLARFLYDLMTQHLPVGSVVQMVMDSQDRGPLGGQGRPGHRWCITNTPLYRLACMMSEDLLAGRGFRLQEASIGALKERKEETAGLDHIDCRCIGPKCGGRVKGWFTVAVPKEVNQLFIDANEDESTTGMVRCPHCYAEWTLIQVAEGDSTNPDRYVSGEWWMPKSAQGKADG
jgi:hypothetical protein